MSSKHYLYWKNVNEIYLVVTILKYYNLNIWALGTVYTWQKKILKEDYHKDYFPNRNLERDLVWYHSGYTKSFRVLV